MKKLLSLLLALTMVFSLATPAFAAHIGVSVNNEKIDAGDSVVVTITLEEPIDVSEGATVMQGELYYDGAVLEYVSAEKSDQLSNAAKHAKENKVLFHYLSMDNSAVGFDAGVLVTVTFKALEDIAENHISTFLEFKNAYVQNAQGENVGDLTCDAGVTVLVCKEHTWNDGEVTTASTCTAAGVKTYTCTFEGCGSTMTEEVAALGHSYENGACAVCGEADPDYVAPTYEPVTVFFSASHDDQYMMGEGGVAALREITVPYFDLALYGLEDFYFQSEDYGSDSGNIGDNNFENAEPYEGKITMLHLFLYATETIYLGVAPEDAGQGYLNDAGYMGSNVFNLGGSVGSSFLNYFWDYDMNLNYYLNYEYPLASAGWGATIDQILLEDGDIVTLGQFVSYSFYSDSTSIFNYMVADNNAPKQGETVNLTLYCAGPNMGNTDGTAQNLVTYMPDVYYISVDELSDGDVTTWNYLGYADEKGQIVLDTTGLEPGQYIVAMPGQYGMEYPDDIVSTPGGVLLTVEENVHVHDYAAVVTEPTCTEGGYTTYTCACGDNYVADETAALGHSYENGTCTICGAEDPDYVAGKDYPFTITVDGEEVIAVADGTESCATNYSGTIPVYVVTVPAGTQSVTITNDEPFTLDKDEYETLIQYEASGEVAISEDASYHFADIGRTFEAHIYFVIEEAEAVADAQYVIKVNDVVMELVDGGIQQGCDGRSVSDDVQIFNVTVPSGTTAVTVELKEDATANYANIQYMSGTAHSFGGNAQPAFETDVVNYDGLCINCGGKYYHVFITEQEQSGAFQSITTDMEGDIIVTEQEMIDGWIPYYHVVVPRASSYAYITYPANTIQANGGQAHVVEWKFDGSHCPDKYWPATENADGSVTVELPIVDIIVEEPGTGTAPCFWKASGSEVIEGFTFAYAEDNTIFLVTLAAGNGYTTDGAGYVKTGEDYSFTVDIKNGYDATNMVVKVNGEVVTADENGVYTVRAVTEDLVITVEGVEAIPSDGDVTFYFSVEEGDQFVEQGGVIWALEEVTVPYFDLALYDMEYLYYNPDCYVDGQASQAPGTAETADGVVTLLHALIWLTEVYYNGLDPADAGQGWLATDGGWNGFNVYSATAGSAFFYMWDFGENFNYYVNYEYPLGAPGWGATCDQIKLSDGDVVSMRYNDNSGNVGTYHHFGEKALVTKTVNVGQSFDLALYYTGQDNANYTTPVYNAGAGHKVYLFTENTIDVDPASGELVGTTDDNGEVTIDTTDLALGTYYIVTDSMSPAVMLLTVESGETEPVEPEYKSEYGITVLVGGEEMDLIAGGTETCGTLEAQILNVTVPAGTTEVTFLNITDEVVYGQMYVYSGSHDWTEYASNVTEATINLEECGTSFCVSDSANKWYHVNITVEEPSHEHGYDTVVTEPTCTEGGYTTYTCSCGDSYVADETAALGHSYENGTCTACGTVNGVAHNTSTDTSYATVAEALEAALEGQSIILLADCTDGNLMVTAGITLDLNGFDLTASYVVTFDSAQIIDSIGGGSLIISQKNLVLQAGNTMVPVYNGSAYIFSKFGFAVRQDTEYTGDGIKINTMAYPVDMDVVELLKDGGADNNVQIVIRLTWDTADGTGSQEFAFTDQVVSDVYSSNQGAWNKYTKMFGMTITGFENITNLKANVVVVSGTGVEYVSSTSLSIT